jgi:coenzyme F420 hydrogenase subunit beta
VDSDVRYRAAAGGTLTALGRYLLIHGDVDAVVHVQASSTTPWLTEAVTSRTADEVTAGSQSRYGPAAPLVHVKRLLDEGVRFAVIAKPCDISAIRSLGRIDRRVAEQVPYLLTIFCGGVHHVNVPIASGTTTSRNLMWRSSGTVETGGPAQPACRRRKV